MFGFRKKTPLISLLLPLEGLYLRIESQTHNSLNSDWLSKKSEVTSDDIYKACLEVKAFTYILVIWGIQASNLKDVEKQVICTAFTKMIAKDISAYSEGDGGNFLRSKLISYDSEVNKCRNPELYSTTVSSMLNLDLDFGLIAWGTIANNVLKNINLISKFINDQVKIYKYEF